MKTRVLIAEDELVQREIINDILELAGYETRGVGSGRDAVEALKGESYDLLLTDMRMPGMDGLELLKKAKALRPDMEAVVMTAHATVATAVSAMKEGACDYLAKPFDKDELLVVVAKAVERNCLRKENVQLRELVSGDVALGNIIGESKAMQKVFNIVSRAVDVSSTVLILGASGTGKELVARHIHFEGPRRNKPFIVVNCAAIPGTLVESELFGHEKGAFTGADTARPGKFEAADTGTLFLDEIGDMSLDSQAKLLRVLQDGMVARVGASKETKVDVRVLAATNQDLTQKIEDGEFRQDLFYRLEVLPVHLPTLRERMDDLPLLIRHFRDKLSSKLGKAVPAIGAEVFEALRRYRWPGNVRELEHTLEQLFILCDDTLTCEDLPPKLRERDMVCGEIALPAGGLILEEVEHDLIRQALERSGGQIKEAAELLGLTYKTLQYRLKKHEIDRKSINP